MLTIVLVGSSYTRASPAIRRASIRLAAISAVTRGDRHFIGAGPGAPDLITVRGLRLIESCPVCLYAGSLVPREILPPPRRARESSIPRR